MPIVSLIGSAKTPLDPALVSSLQSAWGGGDAVWLSPDEAAEFPVEVLPDNASATGDEIRALGVDLAIQPDGTRRKRLLLADMDSTMIGQECIDELAEAAGVGERVAAITARAMNGELDFEAALLERVALLKGLDQGLIGTVLNERIRLARGARTLVATMRANGAYTALVSGGFVQFTSAIAHALGFDEHRANRLLESAGTLSGDVARPILGRAAKVDALFELRRELELDRDDVLAVGDGANDLDMIAEAGLGVALHAKPAIAVAAPVRIDHGDLTALLFLQGYGRDEFVTR
ncbi:MAG: phosphoserine phosphatase SerB [Paracoccaceae bacterium]|nr:phosphoserine phosphatase SerB [Paracoccaceae bacterium]